MQTRSLLVALALAPIMLAGCGSTPQAIVPPSTTASAPSTAVASPETLSEAQYLSLVRDNGTFFKAATDAQTIKVGKDLCALLTGTPGTGLTPWKAAIDASVKAGMPAKEAGGFVVIAVNTYCPAAKSLLPPA